MEEEAPNENREVDLPKFNDVKLAQSCTEDKNQDNEGQDSDVKVDQTDTTPAAMAEGNDPQESVDIGSADSDNQLGNQTVNITVAIDETNKGVIDQEKEKCELFNNDDVTPNDSSVPQIENSVETSNVNIDNKESDSKGDGGEQPDKEEDVEPAVPSEDCAVSAQVIGDKSPEKDDSKTEVPLEQAGEVSASEGMNEAASTDSHLSTQIAGKENPEGDAGKTEISPDGTKNAVPETPASTQLIGNENTTTAEIGPPIDHLELPKNEEQGLVSAETSEKPETTGTDEAGAEEKQPGEKDQDEMDKTEKYIPTAEGTPPQATWYTEDKGNQQQQEAEGYSTTVIGGVTVRKPLPSTSSEPKKPAKVSSTGSVFKKMSWGSIFGRKKPVKDKPDVGQQAATETPVHDGTDGQEEPIPDEKESSTPLDTEDTTDKDASQVSGEPSEATPSDKPQENEPEVPTKEEEKEDIVEGGIVPLEEGVADEEEETTKMVEEAPEQDEQKDDVESPTDEDSLLRERIAKRESATASHSPTKHMQMRMSYAEGSKEVEVIGTREAPLQHKQDKHNTSKDNRLSCRELGEVDHEGWLTKRGGGAIFTSWKRKWVVLKERHVYYYKTAFDPEAGGVVDVKDHTITAVPEVKKKFCFKIEAEDPKAAKLFFAADTQDDMDKWVSVLTAASRGEVIVSKTQNEQSDDVKMRKKTNSLGKKRAESVLGLGGYYSYDGELEKTDPKRRASFGSSPKEADKSIQPVANSENKGRSESPTENTTPSDIQKLITTQTEGDSVDAPVARETSSTAPLQEVSVSPEVTDTVASATDNEEQKPSNIETDVKISSSETPIECPPEITPLEETMTTPETSDTRVETPSEQPPKPSQPTPLSNSTWYYVIDEDNHDWIDHDEQKAMASKRESDELLSLVRTIKDARLSIIGTPLPGNEERARAMTNVSKENEEVLKLREMRRTLKDKQRDLMAIEELFTKEVNRQSIHEWKTRYSYLTPEGDSIDEKENTDKENGSNDEKNEVNGAGIHGGEDQNTRPKDGDEVQRDEKSEVAGNGGEDQDTKPKDDGGGETAQDGKSENAENVQEDRIGVDVATNGKVDTNDIRLEEEDNVGEKKTDKAGELVKQAAQTTEPNNNSGTNKSQLTDQTLTQQDEDSIDTRL